MSLFLILKSWIRAHTRPGPHGPIQVKGYYDRRTKKYEPPSVRRKARVGAGGDAATKKHEELVSYAKEIAEAIHKIEGGTHDFELGGHKPKEAIENLKHQLRHKLAEIHQHEVDHHGKLTPEEETSGLHKKSGQLQNLPGGKTLHASFSEQDNHSHFKPEDHANAVLVHQKLAKQALKLKRDADASHHTDQARQHMDALGHHSMQRTLHGMTEFQKKVDEKKAKDRERKQLQRSKMREEREKKKALEPPEPPKEKKKRASRAKEVKVTTPDEIQKATDQEIAQQIEDYDKQIKGSRSEPRKERLRDEQWVWRHELNKRNATKGFKPATDEEVSNATDDEVDQKIDNLDMRLGNLISYTPEHDAVESEHNRWRDERERRRQAKRAKEDQERKVLLDTNLEGTNVHRHKGKIFISDDDKYAKGYSGFGGLHESQSYKSLEELNKIPQEIFDHVMATGLEIYIGKAHTRDQDDGRKHLTGHPRGFGPNETWDDAAGVFIGSANKIIVAHGGGHNVAAHEFGHAVSHHRKVGSERLEMHFEYQAAHDAEDKKNWWPYLKTKKDGGVQDDRSGALSESFAECFGLTSIDETKARSTFGNGMVDFMKKVAMDPTATRMVPLKPAPIEDHMRELRDVHTDLQYDGQTSITGTWLDYQRGMEKKGMQPMTRPEFDQAMLDAHKKGEIKLVDHPSPATAHSWLRDGAIPHDTDPNNFYYKWKLSPANQTKAIQERIQKEYFAHHKEKGKPPKEMRLHDLRARMPNNILNSQIDQALLDLHDKGTPGFSLNRSRYKADALGTTETSRVKNDKAAALKHPKSGDTYHKFSMDPKHFLPEGGRSTP